MFGKKMTAGNKDTKQTSIVRNARSSMNIIRDVRNMESMNMKTNVNMKQKAGMQRIYRWIQQNRFKYAQFPQISLEQMKKILDAIRAHIKKVFEQKKGQFSIFIDELGMIHRTHKQDPLDQFIISVELTKDNSLLFYCPPIKAVSQVPKEPIPIDYQYIASKLFEKTETISKVLFSYISAAMDMARLEKDRQVDIELGAFIIRIYDKKVSILPAKWTLREEKENEQARREEEKNERFRKFLIHPYGHDQQGEYARRFEDSLTGCLMEDAYIRAVKNNLDEGQSLTKKYLKYQEQFPNYSE